MKKTTKNWIIGFLILAGVALMFKDYCFPEDSVKIHRIIDYLQKRKGTEVDYKSSHYPDGVNFVTEVVLPDGSGYTVSVEGATGFVNIKSNDESSFWFTIYEDELYFASEDDGTNDPYGFDEFNRHRSLWIRRYRATLSKLYLALQQ